MLKLKPNQIIKISTEVKMKKRIYLNFKNIFDDYRQKMVLSIDEKHIKRIIDLKRHIARRYRIREPFYLMTHNDYYLHPFETIEILRDEEIVCLHLKNSENNSRVEITNRNEEIVVPKKRKALDDITENRSKCIKTLDLITNEKEQIKTNNNESNINIIDQENNKIGNNVLDKNYQNAWGSNEQIDNNFRNEDNRVVTERISNYKPNDTKIKSGEKDQILEFDNALKNLDRTRKRNLSEQYEKNNINVEFNKTVSEIRTDSNEKNNKRIVILDNVLISPAHSSNNLNISKDRRDRRERRRHREYVDDSRFEDAVDDQINQEQKCNPNKTISVHKDEEHTNQPSMTETRNVSNRDAITITSLENDKNKNLSKTMMANWTDIDETGNNEQTILGELSKTKVVNSTSIESCDGNVEKTIIGELSRTKMANWTEIDDSSINNNNNEITTVRDLSRTKLTNSGLDKTCNTNVETTVIGELSKTHMGSWTDVDESMNKTNRKTDRFSKTMMTHWTDAEDTLDKTVEENKDLNVSTEKIIREKKRKRTSLILYTGVGCILNQLRNESLDTSGIEEREIKKVAKNKKEPSTIDTDVDSTSMKNEDNLKASANKDEDMKIVTKEKKTKNKDKVKNSTKISEISKHSKNKTESDTSKSNENDENEIPNNCNKKDESIKLKSKNKTKKNSLKNAEYDSNISDDDSKTNKKSKNKDDTPSKVTDNTSLIENSTISKNLDETLITRSLNELSNYSSPEMFEVPDFVTKRKRRRHRKTKKSIDSDDSSIITNTSVEYRPPKTKAAPKIHKKFDDDEFETETERNDTETTNKLSDTTDKFDTSLNTSNEEKFSVTPVDNSSMFSHSTPYQASNKMSVIPEESFVHPLYELIEKSKTMTSKPKVNDMILFKKLRLDENYCPIISDFVYGKILKVSNDGDTKIQVLSGHNELRDPEGKFSLRDMDDIDTSVVDVKWNTLLDIRLISDK